MYNTIKTKPLYRKGFVLLILVVTVGSAFVDFQYFYRSSHVSQLIITLLLLNLFFIFIFFFDTQDNIQIPFPYILLLLAATVVSLSARNDAIIVAIMWLHLLLLLFLAVSCLRQYVPIFLVYVSVCSSVYSIGLFFATKLGVVSFPDGRVIGNYGQANLTATLMLLGLFGYSHLLYVTKRYGVFFYIPSLLMATVLFMTASRAAIVAIGVVGLFLLAQRYKRYSVNLRTHFIRLLCVLIVAYIIAYVVGDWTPLSRAEASWSQGMSTYMRLVFWLSAVCIGLDNLLIGTGFGGYAKSLGDYGIRAAETLHLPYEMIGQTLWAHNDFLQIFSQQGIVVFLLLCFFVILLIVSHWKRSSDRDIFIVLGFISFCCMMCFSHPFYHPNLVLMICLTSAPLLVAWRGKRFVIEKKIIAPFVIITLIAVNFFVVKHCVQMHNLYLFQRHMVESNEPFTQKFINGDQQFLLSNIDNSVYGWQFKHILYINLVERVQKTDNRELGQYILPSMVEYAQQNRFSSYLFSLSKLYYILNDYENAKFYASLANERKPDEDKYFALLHLCNVLLISRNNDIPVRSLVPADDFRDLFSQKVLRQRQLDSKGIAI